MYLEYCNYNRKIDDLKIENQNIFNALKFGILNFAMPIGFIKRSRSLFTSDCVLAAPIDYPLGLSDLKTKEVAALHSLKAGANALDYVLNYSKVNNNVEWAIREIIPIGRICKDFSASLRVFIDFPNRTVEEAQELVYILMAAGVDIVLPTLGYHRVDFFDNIIMTKTLEAKTGVSCIFTGHMWKEDQIGLIKNAKIFGIRIYNIDFWCSYYNRAGNKTIGDNRTESDIK